MIDTVLIDTGPLVAMVDRDDERHRDCEQALHALYGPLVTVWPVLTEAVYLLRRTPRGVDALFTLVETAQITVLPLELDHAWMRRFFSKYADQRPDLADACIVHAAEQFGIRHVVTLDRRDFAVYRVKGRALQTIPVP